MTRHELAQIIAGARGRARCGYLWALIAQRLEAFGYGASTRPVWRALLEAAHEYVAAGIEYRRAAERLPGVHRERRRLLGLGDACAALALSFVRRASRLDLTVPA